MQISHRIPQLAPQILMRAPRHMWLLTVALIVLYFVMRSRSTIFAPPLPSAPIFWAIVGTQIFAVLMVGFGWFVPAIPWTIIGLVWLYMLVWMIALDLVKLALYSRLRHPSGRPHWYQRFLKGRHAARVAAEAAKASA